MKEKKNLYSICIRSWLSVEFDIGASEDRIKFIMKYNFIDTTFLEFKK